MFDKGQNSNGRFLRRATVITVFVVSICLNACSTVRLNVTPPPPPTAKLRVFVQVISEEKRDPRRPYITPSDEWERIRIATVDQYLRATGVYEVVPKEDVRAVLGTRTSGSEQYWWVKKDYALLKEAGKALYADYAIIIIRSVPASVTYKMVLINIETGTQYSASDTQAWTTSPELNLKRAKILFQNIYRKIFYDAKGDLLATAIRKGRLMPEEETKKPEPRETKIALAPPPVPQIAPATPEVAIEKKPAPIAEVLQKPIPPVSTAQEEAKAPIQPPLKPTPEPPPATKTLPVPKPPAPEARPALLKEPLKAKASPEESVPTSPPAAKLPDTIVKQPIPDMKKDTETPRVIARIAPVPRPELEAADKRKEFEKKLEQELQTEAPATEKAKLVVYDFDTVERLNVVALILTDALREELFILGRFSLVNRENIMQVMQELKLQHSGLVDDKEIVELGKWLAANQAVTGRLAVLGKSYVLQAKRTDIKTMGTLGLGTLKCSSGQEEELLSGIPVLARKLIGMKMNVP
ncbi:MAG: hypothetical protein ABSE05_07530 [Syntrophales bacterium]